MGSFCRIGRYFWTICLEVVYEHRLCSHITLPSPDIIMICPSHHHHCHHHHLLSTDLSKNPIGFPTNQSCISHSWFSLNSVFFETPCTRPWLFARVRASWWQHQGKGESQEYEQCGTSNVSNYVCFSLLWMARTLKIDYFNNYQVLERMCFLFKMLLLRIQSESKNVQFEQKVWTRREKNRRPVVLQKAQEILSDESNTFSNIAKIANAVQCHN